MKEYIVPFIDDADTEKFEALHGTECELIRCKDCKAYNGMKCVRNNMIAVRADDFCSRAERRNECGHQ